MNFELPYRAPLPIIPRILKQLRADPETGCLIWTGYAYRGYPLFHYTQDWAQRAENPIRILWRATRGPIPDYHCLRPTCSGGQLCLNIAHRILTKTGYRDDWAYPSAQARYAARSEQVGECLVLKPRNYLIPQRLIWEEMRGPVPEGYVVKPTCEHRKCVLPGHLELVSKIVRMPEVLPEDLPKPVEKRGRCQRCQGSLNAGGRCPPCTRLRYRNYTKGIATPRVSNTGRCRKCGDTLDAAHVCKRCKAIRKRERQAAFWAKAEAIPDWDELDRQDALNRVDR